jgi:hypothetical protein
MSTVKLCPLAMGTPVVHRVPASPSSILAGWSLPPLDDAVTDHPVRSSGRGAVPVGMVTRPVSRMSREDDPTSTSFTPDAVFQPRSQYSKLRASRTTEARWV